MRKPVIYQPAGTVQHEIAGGYKLKGENRVGFELGGYDVRQPLVIDPVLAYSTYLGGSDVDRASGIAVDSAGNAYVTGATVSTNFPTTAGGFQQPLTPGGFFDGFVTKVNSTGTVLLYSTYFGGTSNDEGLGIAVDSAGDAYVTGDTASTNFPITTGAFQGSSGGGFVAFVTKLNSTGAALLYSTYLGPAEVLGFSIAVDSVGSAYVTGQTNSANFPTTSGAFQTSLAGPQATFVAKLNSTGTALLYSTYLGAVGAQGNDAGQGIAVDALGNAYVVGSTSSPNFPITPGAFQTSFGGGSIDAFVTELNSTGTALVYCTYLGGNAVDFGFGIAVDSAGNAYVTGNTDSSNFPTTLGAFQACCGGGFNGFVTKLNSTGMALVYSTYLYGSSAGSVEPRGIGVDFAGDAYVVGSTSTTTFPRTPDATQTSYGGGSADAFVTKLNPKGTALLYSTYLGGSDQDEANGIAVDSAGNAYVAGSTTSTDFPATPGAFQTTYGGGSSDAFVVKIAFQSSTSTALISSANPWSFGQSVTFTATVTPTAATGTVTFLDGATTLGTAPLTSGQATFGTSSLAVGLHSVTAQYSGDSNFSASTSAALMLTVNPAPLTITPDNATKVLDAPNPAFTTSYSGFVNGDTAASLRGTLDCATTATTTSPVGGYPINCSGQSSNNYSITYVQATLKILYASGGICDGDVGHQTLQPINADGTSVWKQGRTIPVKFRVCDANGVSIGTAGVVSSFVLTQIVSGTVSAVDESIDATTADSGFRFDSTAQQWIFNLSTQSESAGYTYVYSINLNDGTGIVFQYGLR